MVHKVLFWGGFGLSPSKQTVGLQLTKSLNRPRSPRMATRSRNATFLQQGITLGVPYIRGDGSKLWVLVARC